MLRTIRTPRVFVRFADWDDINLLDDCILPAVRDGSLLQIVTDPALLHRVYDLDDSHYTIFHTWGYAITSLDIEHYDPAGFPLDTVSLFYAVVAMPSLLELSIRMDHLSDITPETEAPPVPFRLRRLVLYPVFRGWLRLIALSGDSLRDLALQAAPEALERGAPIYTADSGTYADSFLSVTRLRLFDVLDVAIVRGCPKLRTLELHCIDPESAFPDIALCVEAAPRTLKHLVLSLDSSQQGSKLCDVIDLLGSRFPAVAGLRSVIVQPCLEWLPRFQDVLDEEGREARDTLQAFCRQRRIEFSLH